MMPAARPPRSSTGSCTARWRGSSITRKVGCGKPRMDRKGAGARRGRPCWGGGGNAPTLTAAALVAGSLDGERFGAGAIKLRRDLAERAIAEGIAKPFGLEGAEAGAAAMI